MLEIGDVVDVEVQSVKVYGVFCRYESEDLLVLIPETSWIASYNSCEQFAEPGDKLTVKIKHIDAESGKVAGTIRELHPNPWETGLLDKGRKHTARIVRYVPKADRCDDQPAYLVELVPGAFAILCAAGQHMKAGDQVTVVIQKSNSHNNSVMLERQHNGS